MKLRSCSSGSLDLLEVMVRGISLTLIRSATAGASTLKLQRGSTSASGWLQRLLDPYVHEVTMV
jgi:hypothetical protein